MTEATDTKSWELRMVKACPYLLHQNHLVKGLLTTQNAATKLGAAWGRGARQSEAAPPSSLMQLMGLDPESSKSKVTRC